MHLRYVCRVELQLRLLREKEERETLLEEARARDAERQLTLRQRELQRAAQIQEQQPVNVHSTSPPRAGPHVQRMMSALAGTSGTDHALKVGPSLWQASPEAQSGGASAEELSVLYAEIVQVPLVLSVDTLRTALLMSNLLLVS